MARNRTATCLLLAALALTPLASANAADKYKAPTRPDDPVEPIPDNPYYAGAGYVCQIYPKFPGLVIVSLQSSVDCSSPTRIYVMLCAEAELDEGHCPWSSDPDYADSVYSDQRLALTVGLLRDAMNQRLLVRAYRKDIYGYDPDFNGVDQYAHKASVAIP